jgi:hypothetical protein
MGKALDDAWAEIAPSVDDRPEAIQAARFVLADIILSLGAQGNFDPQWLADTAVQLMVSRASRFAVPGARREIATAQDGG